MNGVASVLVIACGALAHEIIALIDANRWHHLSVQCLPADLHNTPALIPERVRETIRRARNHYANIFVAYGDCGTGGLLDSVLAEERVERIPGAHCYEFFAGGRKFSELAQEEPGTFYLTDFLARHFERLVVKGLGLDRHPQLKQVYFGNYRRVVYLAQSESRERLGQARAAAEKIGLQFEHRYTGRGDMHSALARAGRVIPVWQS